MQFYIRIPGNELKEVEGVLILEPCKSFITEYPEEHYERFVVSEYSTGIRIGFGPTIASAKGHAKECIAKVGTERFSKMIIDAIAKYGMANK
jgi:hypothetical protein